MSTWAGIDFGKYSIEEWQNTYHKWLFNDADRVREGDFIGYRIDTETLKRRLELQGVNRASVELEVNEFKGLWIKDMEDLLTETLATKHREEYSCYIDGLKSCSLNSWLKLIPIAASMQKHEITGSWDEPSKLLSSLTKAEQNLLKFMCSEYDEYPNYTAGGYHFPCLSSYSYAWAILQFVTPNSVCELDISPLIDSGWVDDFEDLAEYQAGQTKFSERAKIEIQDITKLSESFKDNNVLQRLSYSGLVTILEAYLADIAKRQVLNKDSIKRRFVENFDAFSKNQKNLKVTEVFFWMEQLDNQIIECLDNLSFHNVKTIKAFFPSVLLVKISDDLSDRLAVAEITRHDIVHRAGRTKDGKSNEVTLADVKAVSTLVLDIITSVDSQIVDGILV